MLYTFAIALEGGFLLYVHVIDVDLAINDLVENIFVDRLLTTSLSFSAPVRYTGSSGNAWMEMSFRVQCSPGFTGADCASSVTTPTMVIVSDPSTEGSNIAAIAGGIAAGVVLMGFVVTMVILCALIVVYKNSKQPQEKDSPKQGNGKVNHLSSEEEFHMGNNPLYGGHQPSTDVCTYDEIRTSE